MWPNNISDLSSSHGDVYGDDVGSEDMLISGVTSDDLDQLKMDAVTCFSDSLFKKLHEIEQVRII